MFLCRYLFITSTMSENDIFQEPKRSSCGVLKGLRMNISICIKVL